MATRELPQLAVDAAAVRARGRVDDPRRLESAVRRAGAAVTIPDLSLRLAGVGVNGARVAAYDRVCGFALRDVLPATYPHMLAFPLQLSLMTDPSFPFPAIGLVHIANRIIAAPPDRSTERLQVDVWSTLAAGPPRGKQFSLLTDVRVGERARVGRGLDQPETGRSSGSTRDVRLGAAELRRACRRPRSGRWRRPRAPVCLGLGRLQPDPRPSVERPPVRVPVGDRPRDVDQGALPGGARVEAPGRVHGAGRVQAPDPAAGQRSSSARPGGGQLRTSASATRPRASRTSTASSRSTEPLGPLVGGALVAPLGGELLEQCRAAGRAPRQRSSRSCSLNPSIAARKRGSNRARRSSTRPRPRSVSDVSTTRRSRSERWRSTSPAAASPSSISVTLAGLRSAASARSRADI